ncbi:MAG: hypothetical protein JRJ85_05645 [Deltaproteobacteria bacterium]|nr:hypothetical protein [Deltaproteobacteria bacterium]
MIVCAVMLEPQHLILNVQDMPLFHTPVLQNGTIVIIARRRHYRRQLLQFIQYG